VPRTRSSAEPGPKPRPGSTEGLSQRAEKLRVRAGVLLTRYWQLQAQEAFKERRRDTRRKVVLGSALIELMRHDEKLRVRIRDALEEHFAYRPRDRGTFDGFFEAATSTRDVEEAELPSAQDEADEGRRDAHRKIILGGTLIPLMRQDEHLRARIQAALESHFATSARDAQVFRLHDPPTFFHDLGRLDKK